MKAQASRSRSASSARVFARANSSSKAWAASIVGITNHGAPTAVSEPADPRAPRKGRQAPPSYKAGRRRRDRRWSRRSWEDLKMAAKRIYSYYIREIEPD